MTKRVWCRRDPRLLFSCPFLIFPNKVIPLPLKTPDSDILAEKCSPPVMARQHLQICSIPKPSPRASRTLASPVVSGMAFSGAPLIQSQISSLLSLTASCVADRAHSLQNFTALRLPADTRCPRFWRVTPLKDPYPVRRSGLRKTLPSA
jgi:hypothetical protein